MHPILFTIPLFGGLTIYTYGVLVATAFLVGMFWVDREARRVGENPARATDLVFYIIVAAIVGSRIVYVLVSEREQFFQDPLSFFRIWEGGLVFYGGFLGALLVALWYIQKHHLNFWRTADIFVPGVALGHAIGRVGCLMAGCCHGRPALHNAWWTLTFPPHEHGFAPPGVPLYPTQPLESIAELLIFAILVVVGRRKRFEGEVFATYLFLYAIVRTALETVRGDAVRGFLFGGLLSTSQAISLLLGFAAIGIWVVRRRKDPA
ncbi:MAG: prolipoprotein diacylglyceryl transferase [Deltaproteobacteria bacterium]|nr:prolipoprotein diacylglyceryl transferase [Deltaproteobacteria bacterium]